MSDAQKYTDDFLSSKRQIGDLAADTFIQEIFKNPEQKMSLHQWMSAATRNNQLKDLATLFPGVLLFSNAAQLPDWADRRLVKAGSDFFVRHAETIMTLLGLLSLPYCYTAANGAMVLYLSERIRKETAKRLYETAVFVWEVMAPGAFEKEGKAFTEIMKVRLMHAAGRYYTLQSGKWDNAWGLPINQEDMAGTNLSFSLLVIRGLRKMGYNVSWADQQSFMHIWNVIGFLSGLDEELIPKDSKMAQHLDRAISHRQFAESSHGRELTKSLTDHIIAINKGKAASNDILGLMRYLLGTEVGNMLSINAPDLPAYKISLLQTLNIFKSFKPKGDTDFAYHKAYAKFKLQKPVSD